MSFTNFETKEIHIKALYFGCAGAGKSTNLKSILTHTSPELKNGLFQLMSSNGTSASEQMVASDRYEDAPFFDFLPLSIGEIHGYKLKLHLYTASKLNLFRTTKSLMMRGLDGCVFVIDSRLENLPLNLEAFEQMKLFLTQENYQLSNFPIVFQYNKRDLGDTLPLDVLATIFNPSKQPEHDSCAIKSVGVLETLESLTKTVIKRLAETPPLESQKPAK